jgi:hypothetical protein
MAGKKNEEKAAEQKPEEVVYGEFWQVTKKEVNIHHEGLLIRLRKSGFCWIRIDGKKRLVQIQGKIVEEVDITDISDYVYQYIQTFVPEFIGFGKKRSELVNLFSRGIEKYINFPKLRLLGIKEISFHFDTKTESFFYFKNGVVKVTADSISLIQYSELSGFLWKKQIRKRPMILLEAGTTGDFRDLCFRICNKDEKKFTSLRSIIGYILHRYWSPSLTKIPIFLDETVNGTDEAQGGTGKTIICLALEHIRNMVTIDGKSFKPGGDFRFQQLDLDTEILFIDDLDRHTSFEFCFSIITAGIEVNQKNKASFRIPKEKTPKPIITSNFPVKSIAGNSTERRKIEFEVSSYYGAKLTPSQEFGRDFFQDWSGDDFNKMFNFFIYCCQFYLQNGIVDPPSVNTEMRRLISDLGGADLKDFLDEKVLEGSERWIKKDIYDEFCTSHYGLKKYYSSQNKFTTKVKKYFDFRSITYDETASKRKAFQLDYSTMNEDDTAGDADESP